MNFRIADHAGATPSLEPWAYFRTYPASVVELLVDECFGLQSSAGIAEREQGGDKIRYHSPRFTLPGGPTPIRRFPEHRKA